MGNEIVERLRLRNVPYGWPELADKAAAEIEQLQAWLDGCRRACDLATNELEALRPENERLHAETASARVVCDSYARENQQFYDEIERLRAFNDEAVNTLERRNTEVERLRSALQGIVAEETRSDAYEIAQGALSGH